MGRTQQVLDTGRMRRIAICSDLEASVEKARLSYTDLGCRCGNCSWNRCAGFLAYPEAFTVLIEYSDSRNSKSKKALDKTSHEQRSIAEKLKSIDRRLESSGCACLKRRKVFSIPRHLPEIQTAKLDRQEAI